MTDPSAVGVRANTLRGPETECVLVSASCTTSWFDWIHGELWLCDGGLLRRSLGLVTTFAHSRRRTVDPDNRPTRSFAANELAEIVAAGRRNRWIRWSEIRHATLKLGVVDHSLHLDLTGDRHEKFLWLAADGGFDLLEKELQARLPGRFIASRKRLG
jgi:hypothetical protein